MATVVGLGVSADRNQAKFSVPETAFHGFRDATSVGDINGDGFSDFSMTFLVGALGPAFLSSSTTMIVYGSSSRFFGELDFDTLDGSVVSGARTVKAAGDVNGDDLDDLLIHGFDGRVGVLFGDGADLPASLSLDDIDGANGFVVGGALPDPRGSVAAAGDVNGDGFDDIVIGSPVGGPAPFDQDFGAIFVVYGTPNAGDAPTSVEAIDGTNGFRIDGGGIPSFLGTSVGGLDLNGDGLSDVIGGAPGHEDDSSSGVYVSPGRSDDMPAALSVDSLPVPILIGRYGVGFKLASAGDFNGDGFEDFVVAGRTTDSYNEGLERTEAFVLFGGIDGLAGNSAAEFPFFQNFILDGVSGFSITSSNAFDGLSYSLAGGGDVNGDGFDDIVIGAPNNIKLPGEDFQNLDDPRDNIGAAYILFGTDAAMAAEINVTTLPDNAGFRLLGETPSDGAGSAVAIVGDVDGDGFDDILVSATGSFGERGAGATYLVYGSGDTGGGGGLLTTEIVVYAAGTGTSATGDAPIFDVIADGRLVGSSAISNPIDVEARRAGGLDHQPYRFFASGDAAPQSVEIVYRNNSLTASGVDKNLYVDRIEVGGRTLEAEIAGLVTSASGSGPAIATEAMVRNSTMSFDLVRDLGTVITVHAGGTGGPGAAPRFSLLVDGELISGVAIAAAQSRAEVRADGWRTDAFTFVIDGSAPPETVAIIFDNDGVDPLALEDVNLHIDAIEVDGVRLEAETVGVYMPDSGIADRSGPRETLYWNGALLFDLA